MYMYLLGKIYEKVFKYIKSIWHLISLPLVYCSLKTCHLIYNNLFMLGVKLVNPFL